MQRINIYKNHPCIKCNYLEIFKPTNSFTNLLAKFTSAYLAQNIQIARRFSKKWLVYGRAGKFSGKIREFSKKIKGNEKLTNIVIIK